jgi:hypothetical protein
MVSFLTSLLTMQDSPQEETRSEMEGGENNIEGGEICRKIEEEDMIYGETEEVEDEEIEEEEEENFEEGEVEEEEDEEMGDNGVEEGRDKIKFKRGGYTVDTKGTDHIDSGCSTSPQIGEVSGADTQKVKVSCSDGSATWCKLLSEFNQLMKTLKDVNEVCQLVQLLQSMHSIIRCVTEVIVLLENDCCWPPDETRFIIIFFHDYFGDVIRLLMQILATLSYEEEEEELGECVILMCLEMVGSVLHMPESRYASQQDVETAVTLLSLPWHKQVPPRSDMSHSLLSLVTQLTALSSKFSNYVMFIKK